MAIHYKVVECSNPAGAIGVDYAYNRAVKTGDYTFKELAEDIQFATTVTKADVVAVLTAMKEYIKTHLLQGQRVVLDELGALKISMKSKCFA
jgi:predicted histone-like DNA-binding protein